MLRSAALGMHFADLLFLQVQCCWLFAASQPGSSAVSALIYWLILPHLCLKLLPYFHLLPSIDAKMSL